MTFFGYKKKASAETNESNSPSNTAKRKADELDDQEWEIWPEQLFEDAERQEREDHFQELETLSQEIDKRRHHGKEIVPNPKKEATPEEEWWECPICQRPQTPNEKQFNEHIDLCLSRQTIRDAVQETSVSDPARDHILVPKRARIERGKDRSISNSDPKQRRLCFG